MIEVKEKLDVLDVRSYLLNFQINDEEHQNEGQDETNEMFLNRVEIADLRDVN
jgi:hypothetical protein